MCSLLWPQDPLAKCPVSPNYNLTNIVLRDITINSPKTSPGVLWGNLSNPMDITFDNVVVNGPGPDPFGDAFCERTATIMVPAATEFQVSFQVSLQVSLQVNLVARR